MNDSVQRVVADVSQKDIQLSFAARYDGTDAVRRPPARAGLRRIASRAADASRSRAIGRSPPTCARGDSIRRASAISPPARSTRRSSRPVPPRRASSPKPTSPSRPEAGSRDSRRRGASRGRFAPASVQALVADVTLGANRVQASGALGRAGDRLALVVAAKRLAELDALLPADVPKPVSGAIDATASVDTLARGARLDVDARATQLARRRRVAIRDARDRRPRDPRRAAVATARRRVAGRVAGCGSDRVRHTPPAVPSTRALTLTGNAAAHTLSFAASDGEAERRRRRCAASLAGSGPDARRGAAASSA